MGEDWKAFCERAKETTKEITSSLDNLEEELMMDKLAEYQTPKYNIGDLVCAICPDYKHSIIIAKINCIILEDPKVVGNGCQPIYILEGSTQQYYEEELHYYKR